MSRNIASFLVVGALGSLVGFSAQALPMSLAPIHAIRSDITPVAGGCGIGFHRGVYGYCVRNGYVAAPYYAPPAVVAPLPYYAAPVVPRACPYPYRLDAYGRCVPW